MTSRKHINIFYFNGVNVTKHWYVAGEVFAISDCLVGTDVLGSILPHTLDIKHGLLFTEGGVSLQLHCRDAALSRRVSTVGHYRGSMPPIGLLEGLTVFSENTGLVVGRTLVDPSGWKVPVLVSNFGQETVMVEPFSEIGMIAQVAAIQPVMNQPPVRLVTRRCCQNIYGDCWTGRHTTWTICREASWQRHYWSLWICSPYRALP